MVYLVQIHDVITQTLAVLSHELTFLRHVKQMSQCVRCIKQNIIIYYYYSCEKLQRIFRVEL